MTQDKSKEYQSVNRLGGIRHKSGVNLIQALMWNVGTCRSDVKGEAQVQARTRARVPMQRTGAQ